MPISKYYTSFKNKCAKIKIDSKMVGIKTKASRLQHTTCLFLFFLHKFVFAFSPLSCTYGHSVLCLYQNMFFAVFFCCVEHYALCSTLSCIIDTFITYKMDILNVFLYRLGIINGLAKSPSMQHFVCRSP